jgi:PQQ-like domain
MPAKLPATLFVVCTFLVAQLALAQVTTSQYDNARTGAYLGEKTLSPQNVNAKQFGKIFALPVDGDVYAQPLYVPGVEIPGQGKHNVVYIATENDSVYAFDAEGNPKTPLWQVSFIDAKAGITTLSEDIVSCPFIAPKVGITSTPVIDLKSGTLYVLARTRESAGVLRSSTFHQRLHALAITTGVEKFGGPVEIKASVTGSGGGSTGGSVAFDPWKENPRAALLLVNGIVYLTWASSCDVGPYHGWVLAYDAQTLQQKGVFNVSPDAEEGGIWAGDAGPAADSDGNIFVATGNGKFDAGSNGRDYGDSMLKLSVGSDGLALRDYFTPANQEQLNASDSDLGSGGPVLLPNHPGPHPHLLLIGGKGATLYLLDRDRLGKYQKVTNIDPLQTIPAASDILGAVGYWNKHVYFLGSQDVLRDFALENGKLVLKVNAAGPKFTDPGATPTISADGTKKGVVWVIGTKTWNGSDRPAVLHAYDAVNVARELYNTEQNSARDRPGLALRFTIPTVVNSRVYVGAKSEVDVYGLLVGGK